MIPLNFGFLFKDLISLAGLTKIDEKFLAWLENQDIDLHSKLQDFRFIGSSNIKDIEYSEFLIALAPFFDDFIAELFNIEDENFSLKKQHEQYNPIYECRRKFIQRYALKKYPIYSLDTFDFNKISQDLNHLLGSIINERNLALNILEWQKEPQIYELQLDIAAKYCSHMVVKSSSIALFNVPRALDENNHVRDYKIKQLEQNLYLGFDCRDHASGSDVASMEAKYCIYCHKQNKDSCSKGLDANKKGCPLKQKISEMNLLKNGGFNIGALGVAVIDNPLLAATGHRICNDCMKACIFQKQDPVNIPYIESNILSDVLSLPWGVEIYLLLTKWNPLNIDSPLPRAANGYNVMIAGLGPAGIALSHYLLNEGHNVVAIEGIKISPLHFDINKPIKSWLKIKIPLSKKPSQGFGGVMEYGITNRWDKNNLTLLRLILARRENFKMHGGVRLGSNITTKQVLAQGFDHIALCIGAGKPVYANLPGFFAKGVRSSADFLMQLQQGNTYDISSNVKLLVRPPFVVIGCGLTAIDSATELMQYYPVIAEKFLKHIEKLENTALNLSEEETQIANEIIEHAKLFRAAPTAESKINIMQNLGGVTICYRKSIKESPAYRLNHEEIEHALALGIKFEENISPEGISTDQFGYANKIKFNNGVEIPAKTVLIAIGINNNESQDIDDNEHISRFGDCDPRFAGSVVRALASVKDGYKLVSQQMMKNPPKLLNDIYNNFKSTIVSINILSEGIIELVIHAPLIAINFKPGQFFKLQNYSSDITKLMKPLAVAGSYANVVDGTIALIIQEMGTSSKLCRDLKVGDEVVLMGPLGRSIKIVRHRHVALIGEGFRNSALIAIGRALKKNNCTITYFAGYKNVQSRFYIDKIEEIGDHVIWSCEEKRLSINRDQDFSICGNILESIRYAKDTGICNKIDYVISFGSDRTMKSISVEKMKLFGSAKMVCSINSPMQCMMKGICGQCIQKVDDARGYIFSCAEQDQDSSIVDFDVLRSRLEVNSLLEKIVARIGEK